MAREYLSEFPDMATNTLARMAYAEHPQLWSSLEACRGMLRTHRDERSDRKISDPIAVRDEETKRRSHGWNRIPKSLAETYEDFKLPVACNNILLLSDIHFPFHDVRALEIALQHGKDRGVNCIVLNGDILDFYNISRFIKDPRTVDIATELEMLRQFLELLKDEFACPVYFKQGNHEERWEIYLKTKAPELLNVHEFRLDVLCRFGEMGVVYIDNLRIIDGKIR